MQADVECGGIIVEGDVKGTSRANDRIELKSTARYEGDLRASKLTVDEGARVQRPRHASAPKPSRAAGARHRAEPGAAGRSCRQRPVQPQGQPVK